MARGKKTISDSPNQSADSSEDLEAQWSLGAQSAAQRAALVCRALSELPPESHASWAGRIARCFEDIALSGNPLLSDRLRPQLASGMENLTSSLAHGVLELSSNAASLDAVSSVLSRMKIQHPEGGSFTPSALAGSLFSCSLKRFASEGRFTDIASAIGLGAKLNRLRLDDLLPRDGEAFNNPVIAAETARTLKEEHFQGRSRGSKSLTSIFYHRDFFTCPNPVWRSIILNAFSESTSPEKELRELWNCRNTALTIKKLTPEYAEKYNAEIPKSHRQSPVVPYGHAEREHASAFAKMLLDQWLNTAKSYAKTSPAALAKHLLCDHKTSYSTTDRKPAYSKYDCWTDCGLDTVDAMSFLDIPKAQEKKYPELSGIFLSHLDCLALTGASRETLQNQADAGSKPSGNLFAVLGSFACKQRFSETDLLWLCSFDSNSAPLPKRKALRV